MFVIRFEDKKTGFLFVDRHKIKNKKIRKIINNLAVLHKEPQNDQENGMPSFREVSIKNRENKFCFTPYAFENKEVAKNLVKLSKFKRIKVKIINNPEIIWIGKSGIQVAVKA